MILNISGMSGSGKTTLAFNASLNFPYLCSRLITYATRYIRPGEKDGVDYKFISTAEYDQYPNWKLVRKSPSGLYGVKEDDLTSYATPFLLSTFPPIGVVRLRSMGYEVKPFFIELNPEECINRLRKRGEDEAFIKERMAKDQEETSLSTLNILLPNDNVVLLNGLLTPDQLCQQFFEFIQRLPIS